MNQFDVIIVGSGASGVHAAYPLVEAGLKVLMLDIGHQDDHYAPLIPDQPFPTIRRTDPAQHRYFLGDRFEGVALGALAPGPQVTPPRQHVLRQIEGLTPTRSRHFTALESLATGGLGGAWGAVSFPYLESELKKSGLPAKEIFDYYNQVARRIGVSGGRDDLQKLRGPLEALQPPLRIDSNAERIYERYQQRRGAINALGITLGNPLIAALSEPLGQRRGQSYHDMDFWTNAGDSVYRPSIGVKELEQHPNFQYQRGWYTRTFTEDSSGTLTVQARNQNDGSDKEFAAKRLVLAAGALGTARIVLRSFGQYDVAVPVTCNSHSYVPCIHYRGLGHATRDAQHSLSQLSMIYDPTGDGEHLVQAQLYSYRSLMLFRLMKESPLAGRESLRVLQALTPQTVIWVIQHEDYQSDQKYCRLRRDGGNDYLQIVYQTQPEDERRYRDNERAMIRAMRALGCWRIKSVHTEHGSSIHYASTLPMTTEEKPLTTTPSGQLRGTRGVYIADGSAFRYLPAKGPTLTLMANAARIGDHVARTLRQP